MNERCLKKVSQDDVRLTQPQFSSNVTCNGRKDMADLCSWRKETWTLQTIKIEGIVFSNKLLMWMFHMLDSEGLRQKNKNNRRQVCMGIRIKSDIILGSTRDTWWMVNIKTSKSLECVKQWCDEVKG